MDNNRLSAFARSVAPLFLLFLITYVMFAPIEVEILKVANKIFSKVKKDDETGLRTLIFLTFAGIGIVKFIYDAIIDNRYVTIVSSVNFSSLLFIYLLFRSSDNENFIRFAHSSIALTDIIFLLIFVFFSNYNLKRAQLTVSRQLIVEDNIDEFVDLLGRDEYVRKVAGAVNSSISSNSIGISINAEWGFGKTFFLKKVESELNLSTDNIIIWFNPWDREAGSISVDLFFDKLELALQPYSSKISKQIRNYSDNVMKPEEGDTLAFNFLRRTLNILIPRTSIDKQKSEINKAIKKTGKRLVVFIDDLDRLNGSEISNVMQLMRRSADFVNTFFIVALDRSYVTNSLSETGNVYNSSKYLDKIFQMEILLPPLRGNTRKTLFLNLCLNFYGIESTDYNTIAAGIEKISSDPDFRTDYQDRGNINILEAYLENMRDVKRFFNSFNIAYGMIQGDVDIDEFLLLELIKYKSSSLYRLVSNGELLETADIFFSRWQFCTSQFSELESDENKVSLLAISKTYMPIFKRTLLYLYPGIETQNADEFGMHTAPEIMDLRESSVVHKKNHARYFNYNLFGDFSIRQFKEAIQGGIDAVLQYIDLLTTASAHEHNSENALNNYLRYLERYSFGNLTEFKLGLHSFLYALNFITTRNADSIFTDLFTRSKVTQFFGDADHSENTNDFLINELLANPRLGRQQRLDFTSNVIHSYSPDLSVQARYSFFPRINDFTTQYKIIFREEIEAEDSNEQKVFFMLDRGFNMGILDSVDYQRYRDYLNTRNSYFIKSCLSRRFGINDMSGQFGFFGHRDEIFGSDEGFKDFLEENNSNPCANYVLAKFLEFETSSNYDEFIVIPDYNEGSPCL